MTYDQETDKALEIVRNAGELALSLFHQPIAAEEKQDTSPVTRADRECEKLITRSLLESFAGDGILGEEGTSIPTKSGRRWLIDPIDGTRDFVRRNSFWSIQLALEVEGQIVLGIIYCPTLKEMLYAVSGRGCYWNGARVAASDITRVDKSILMVSGFKAAWDSWPADAVRRLTQECWTVRCYGGCYDVIMLARGKADIWLSGSGMEWDYAPVQVIAKECGALFLTRDGDNRINAKHCVAFTAGIEREIREILSISDRE
jgi:histidinol-phosphatase